MALADVISQIDAEIAKLQQAKSLLGGTTDALKPTRGRPKGTRNNTAATVATTAAPATPAKRERKLSPEGRKAIADAMKKRWAERRKDKAAA